MSTKVWGGKSPPWRGTPYTGPPLKKEIELHIDFFSPFGYLGSLGIEEIADHYGCSVRWCPMLLGKSYFGPTSVMKMPAVPTIPFKGPYTTRDIPRLAALMQVPLQMNMMLPPTHCGRAFWHVHGMHGVEAATKLARAMYKAHWTDGHDLGQIPEIARVAVETLPDLVTQESMVQGIQSSAAKSKHAAGVQTSIASGVWGSPTFLVDGEMFWGVDRLWMVEEWLRSAAEQVRLGLEGKGWLDSETHASLPSYDASQSIVVHTSVYPEEKSKL